MTRMTLAQERTLGDIQKGFVWDGENFLVAAVSLAVISYQHSRDGEAMVAHRTVVREGATGDNRTDYRTEMFRIQRDGTTRRL